MRAHSKPRYAPGRARQLGQAFLLVVLLLVVGIGALIFNLARPGKVDIERGRITANALEQAKTALIGFAAGVDLFDITSAARPGDLPCPDRDDNGTVDVGIDTPCAGGALGRLPWKSLGLPDLRDGDGERLWYAVSSNFKNSPRTACGTPGLATCLNSDARGTITVRNTAGTVINDGSNPDAFTPSGVIAVIFAPGAVLRRQGAASAQDRSCTGGSCTGAGVCTSAPLTLTPKCNPINYLDVLAGVEDNADFTDGSNTNGFINGVIRDAGGNAIVNDRLMVITYQDLMPVLQRRVAKEVLNCLNAYASVPQNNSRYPWAAPITDVTPPYDDAINTRFGRVPDGPFGATLLGLGGSVTNLICSLTPLLCMDINWPASCSWTVNPSWWTNWQEMVFYGVAQAYQPADSLLGVPAPGGCGSCLTVDPPSSSADKRVVVVVAGKRLSAVAGGQPRSGANKSDPSNYVEGNNVPPSPYTSQNNYTQLPTASTFNDFLLYQ